eukprot:TRINITY_DN4875_c0_g1_i3.p1 TRINITY_DN4875_c0_g1~~TRINITY_DN4875_c0_g1_i3.p1  ORF type:complete len:457 (+),score=77.32 TRINITY_DN4875_c0_g1_i3:1730-3100(+)
MSRAGLKIQGTNKLGEFIAVLKCLTANRGDTIFTFSPTGLTLTQNLKANDHMRIIANFGREFFDHHSGTQALAFQLETSELLKSLKSVRKDIESIEIKVEEVRSQRHPGYVGHELFELRTLIFLRAGEFIDSSEQLPLFADPYSRDMSKYFDHVKAKRHTLIQTLPSQLSALKKFRDVLLYLSFDDKGLEVSREDDRETVGYGKSLFQVFKPYPELRELRIVLNADQMHNVLTTVDKISPLKLDVLCGSPNPEDGSRLKLYLPVRRDGSHLSAVFVFHVNLEKKLEVPPTPINYSQQNGLKRPPIEPLLSLSAGGSQSGGGAPTNLHARESDTFMRDESFFIPPIEIKRPLLPERSFREDTTNVSAQSMLLGRSRGDSRPSTHHERSKVEPVVNMLSELKPFQNTLRPTTPRPATPSPAADPFSKSLMGMHNGRVKEEDDDSPSRMINETTRPRPR